MKKYLIFLIAVLVGCTYEREISITLMEEQQFYIESTVKQPNFVEFQIRGFTDDSIQLSMNWTEYSNVKPANQDRIIDLKGGEIDSIYIAEWYRDTLHLNFNPKMAKRGNLNIKCLVY